MEGSAGKRRISPLLIRVAWNMGLGAVGAVGAALGKSMSSSMSSSYIHSSSVSGVAGRAAGGGTDGVGVGGGRFRRAERRGTEPAAALFAEARGWMKSNTFVVMRPMERQSM